MIGTPRRAQLPLPADAAAGPPPGPRKRLLLRLWRQRRLFLLVGDAGMFFSALIIAYLIRFHVPLVVTVFPPVGPVIPPLDSFIHAGVLLSLFWLALIVAHGAYRADSRLVMSFGRQLHTVFVTGVYSFILLMAVGFVYREMLVSRLVYLIAFPVAILLWLLFHLGFRLVEALLGSRGVLEERVVVVGAPRRAAAFLSRLQSRDKTLKVMGLIANGAPLPPPREAGPLPTLGAMADIADIHARTAFSALFFVTDDQDHSREPLRREQLIQALNFCEQWDIPVYIVPEAFGVAVASREVGAVSGFPVIKLRDAALHPVYRIIKRLTDIILSVVILVVTLPLLAVVALAVKLTSPGPVIYAQRRAGLQGRPFWMYKFRTMVADADERLRELVDFDHLAEPVFNIRQDPRVTPVGSILRRWSLDELPQFVNVLKGEMSIVGPRPERVELVAVYNAWQRRRLKAKPGITGYQQVMDRGSLSLERRVTYDLYYLKRQNFWLDLFIMLKTLVVIIRGDGLR